MSKICNWFALFIFVGSVLLAAPAQAMKITPPRLVIEPNQKVAHVYVKNDKARTVTYRFRWKGVAMTKDGQIVNLDQQDASLVPGYRAAEPYLRYSPRRVTLKPGDTQRLTFLVRRAPDMVDGEYRSHFVIETEPDADSDNEQFESGENTSVGVDFLLSRAFPIYLLNGNVDANIQISSARYMRHPQSQDVFIVKADIVKQGNRSAIGVLDVLCGDVSVAKSPKVFSVYAEADRRTEEVVVDGQAVAGCKSGLKAVATGNGSDFKGGQVLATAPVAR